MLGELFPEWALVVAVIALAAVVLGLAVAEYLISRRNRREKDPR